MGFLVALGVLGIFLALSRSKGGGAPAPEPGVDRFLFEGRYWTGAELRDYLRGKYQALAIGYRAILVERRDTGAVSPGTNRIFLDAVTALGLPALDLGTIDATMEAMRQAGIMGEDAYQALSYYISTRSDGALIDPYEGDDVAAAPASALEARADVVQHEDPALAESLRDVAEVRRAVDEEVAQEAPAPAPIARAVSQPQPAAPQRLTAEQIAALSFSDLGEYVVDSRDPAGWTEIERRLSRMTDGQLSLIVSQAEASMGGANMEGKIYLQGLMDRCRAIVASRTAAPVAQQAASSGPAGYDPDLARRLAPGVALAIRTAPYAAGTKTLVSRFQVAAFGGIGDGKYGGKTKGALRYYGISNPPNALYRPLAEVAYVAPN